jgi:hypothetical protein
MSKYPLLFTFGDRLDVRGSLVEVTVHGRVLAVQEPEGWWFNGVAPGDIAESGTTAGEAQAAFRKAFSEVLLDIAGSSPDVSTFREEVNTWFAATNEPVEKDWLAAVEEVRAGRVDADLERKPADTPRWVEVNVIKRAPVPLHFDPPMEVAA